MTAHLTPAPAPTPRDPLDAMLRGRYAQQPFWRWLVARLIDNSPK